MSELSHQPAPETKVETYSQGTEEAFSATTLAAFPTGTNPARLQRQPLNPTNVLALQRTIGNQAVQRLIKQKQNHQTAQAVQRLTGLNRFQATSASKIERLSTGGAVVQRFPSYSAFEKGWQKKTTRHKITVFGSTSADYAHNAPGAKLNDADKFHKADILAAYQLYDSSRSMDALTELFHTITYWETLNQANSNQPWFKLAMEYLAELKDRIKAKVQAKVAKQHGPNITSLPKPFQQVPFSRSNQTSKIKNWGIEQKMPGFLKEVGVTPQYYAANLHPYPKRVQSLHKYYTALQDGNLSEAAKAYQDVSDVPNMHLVRPLFVAHFAQATKMDKLIGTDAQSNVGQELTPEEERAILIYSGSEYKPMNNMLREGGSKQYPEFPVEADRSEDSMKKYKAGFKEKQADFTANFVKGLTSPLPILVKNF